jgi:hypothetical protein
MISAIRVLATLGGVLLVLFWGRIVLGLLALSLNPFTFAAVVFYTAILSAPWLLGLGVLLDFGGGRACF